MCPTKVRPFADTRKDGAQRAPHWLTILIQALALLALFPNGDSAGATEWGLNSFSDSVYWSDFIVVARVVSVDSVRGPEDGECGRFSAEAHITAQVIEKLKGRVAARIRVRGLDLGDRDHRASPYHPLPARLAGEQLLLFLKSAGRDEMCEARGGFLVSDGLVRHVRFADLGDIWAGSLPASRRADNCPLGDIRAMVAQLNLVQAACPRDKYKIKNEEAALAGCRVALLSEYDQVVWYGARRLLDRDIPQDFVNDLTRVLERQEGPFPVGYLVVQCLGRTRSKKAVPALIGFMKKTEASQPYAARSLGAITGRAFGEDVSQWERWWSERQKEDDEKRSEKAPVKTGME